MPVLTRNEKTISDGGRHFQFHTVQLFDSEHNVSVGLLSCGLHGLALIPLENGDTMFEIIIGVCLGTASICAERLLPVSIETQDACEQAAPGLARSWAEARSMTLQDARCVGRSDLATAVPSFETKEIAPGVFVHKGQHGIPSPDNEGDLTNLGFIVGDDAVAVIDAGTSRAMAERLYSAIRTRTGLPIKWLLITHMHPDHSLGASFFREAGARIVGHPNLESALANRANSYETALSRLLGQKAYLGTELVGPDEAFESQKIDLGGRILQVTAHPIAHTDNDLTVLDTKTGTWFVGDLVFAEHTPALDGAILGWQKLLSIMAETPAERVVPGHGPAMLDWPSGGSAIRNYLAALTAETRSALAAGEPMSRAIHHLGESQRGEWLLFDEFNKRNATAAYKELEWE